MSKVVVVGNARTASQRLPNKVIFDLGGKPAFVQVIERLTCVVKADYVFVATTREAQDDPIALLAKHHGIECWRGAQETSFRNLSLAEYLNLKDDDWWVAAACDSVLGLADYLPWAMEMAEKYHCDLITCTMPKGSLIEAFWTACGSVLWGETRETCLNSTVVQGEGFTLHPDGFHLGPKKYLIVHWPDEYLVPWHYGPMMLDHPIQGMVIKEIYRQLYKGYPIDLFDVHKLLQREPRLATMVPLTLPRAANHSMPFQEQDPLIEGIKQNAKYIELTWKGGKGVNNTDSYSGKYENKQGGRKRV